MLFPSKRDRWLGAVLWGPVVAMLAIAPHEGSWETWAIALPTAAFIGWLWWGTNYTLTPTVLKIRCGPFWQTGPLSAIHAVRPTRTLLSGAALSLDRLLIRYGTRGVAIVSPQDRDGFVRALEARCPKIERESR